MVHPIYLNHMLDPVKIYYSRAGPTGDAALEWYVKGRSYDMMTFPCKVLFRFLHLPGMNRADSRASHKQHQSQRCNLLCMVVLREGPGAAPYSTAHNALHVQTPASGSNVEPVTANSVGVVSRLMPNLGRGLEM